MVELSKIKIDSHDRIIETRNKIYRLAKDLEIKPITTTSIATLTSEVLHTNLKENLSSQVVLGFSKHNGFYYLNILIECPEKIYASFANKHVPCQKSFTAENDKTYFKISEKIQNDNFVPNKEFIQEEQERLIQQSSSEMLHEIRRKNEELSKALRDLKSSGEIIQVEKMRALGGLTAGVAHELNNPMMGILNFVQYAIKHTDENDRKYRPLVDAEREVKRCQDIISNLLTFSRMKAEGEEDFAEIKISTIYDRVIQLLAYKIKTHNVNVQVIIPDNEPEIKIKINKIQQVILNIVANAIDAMQDSAQKDLTFKVTVNADSLILEITDTGSGMDEETIDKIFEPFYTTKETGKGTGLGLAVSQSIIEEHQGSLYCKSKPGKGTSFIIQIPMHMDIGCEEV